MSIPFLSELDQQEANDYHGNLATHVYPLSSKTRCADFSAQP